MPVRHGAAVETAMSSGRSPFSFMIEPSASMAVCVLPAQAYGL
jgi:hypothetical protein